MRARNIKPGFFINCELSEVDFASRLLFIGLWCYADREGRFEWKPKQIKAAIFPYDAVNIDKLLCNLMSLHFITRHDNTGYVENFKLHQSPHPHEAKSKLPEKSEQNQCHDKSVTLHGMSCECNADVIIPDIIIPDIIIPDIIIPDSEKKILSVSQAKADPIPYDLIMGMANQILGKKFRATEKHKSIIRARWNEGFREDDFATVCSTMLVVWGSDPKMQPYLRPETLFGNKMDGYLNTVPVESRELSKSEQWRKETAAEVDAFVYGGRNDQNNGQHTGQAAICELHDAAIQSPRAEIRQGSDGSLL